VATRPKPKVGARPKNKRVTPTVHARLKAMLEAGAGVRALMAEAGLQQKEVADKYGFRPGDVSYALERGEWPPRGSTSQRVCIAICAELGLPVADVWPGTPEDEF
jgi:DNA-binding XRE family transcriptional regulator